MLNPRTAAAVADRKRVQPAWQALLAHAERAQSIDLKELFSADPDRAGHSSLRLGPVEADFAYQRIDQAGWDALYALADAADLAGGFAAMAAGATVNVSERRQALHGWLRAGNLAGAPSEVLKADVAGTQQRFLSLADCLAAGQDLTGRPVSDIISIGIGGSDLGPRLLAAACPAREGAPRLHFISNVDAHPLPGLLASLDPARTRILLVSKSFTTAETLTNAQLIREWIEAAGVQDAASQMFAVTAHPERARAWGMQDSAIFPFWDWVGGRYSVWSSVGLAPAAAWGAQGFKAFLDGAAAMDAHVLNAPLRENLAVRMALAGIWNHNVLGMSSHLVAPYDTRLELFPAYLQQLEMESNGKSVDVDGVAMPLSTAPALFGGTGTDCQHSFFQALHQGTDPVSVDFIGVLRPSHPYPLVHRRLLANLLAQAGALAFGRDARSLEAAGDSPALAAQRASPGNRPSTCLFLDSLDPHSLGMLIALYEHKVFAQAWLWRINAFDQWGVELGKQIAMQVESALAGETAALDPATLRRVELIRQRGV